MAALNALQENVQWNTFTTDLQRGREPSDAITNMPIFYYVPCQVHLRIEIQILAFTG